MANKPLFGNFGTLGRVHGEPSGSKPSADEQANSSPDELCSDCEGTGYGPCANCGDGYTECACDEPEETDCDSCEGTGISPSEEPS